MFERYLGRATFRSAESVDRTEDTVNFRGLANARKEKAFCRPSEPEKPDKMTSERVL